MVGIFEAKESKSIECNTEACRHSAVHHGYARHGSGLVRLAYKCTEDSSLSAISGSVACIKHRIGIHVHSFENEILEAKVVIPYVAVIVVEVHRIIFHTISLAKERKEAAHLHTWMTLISSAAFTYGNLAKAVP